MKKNIFYLFMLVLVTSSCRSKEDSLILGTWKVTEYMVSGIKYESGRVIEFKSNGLYRSYEESDTIKGEWRLKHNTLVLHQPEITDMHGTRQVNAFTRVWDVKLAENYLLMTGTARSNTQDMRLILERQ